MSSLYTLQETMSAFKAVLDDGLSPEERQKRACRFRRALISPLPMADEDESEHDQSLDEVVRYFLEAGNIPGRTMKWKPFYKLIYAELGKRSCWYGHSRRSIQRSVRTLKTELGIG